MPPQQWRVKAAQVYLSRKGRPTDRTYWLIIAWQPETGERKYFVSTAPPSTTLEVLLRVAFHRWHIELYQPECTSSARLYPLAA